MILFFASKILKTFFVYIMASKSKVLYVGFSNGLELRVFSHKKKHFGGFTAKYNVDRLAYYEEHEYVLDAITREKQIKRWKREWKISLIESMNPEWRDLSDGWFEGWGYSGDSCLRRNEKINELPSA
jgi:putative endonuclease